MLWEGGYCSNKNGGKEVSFFGRGVGITIEWGWGCLFGAGEGGLLFEQAGGGG